MTSMKKILAVIALLPVAAFGEGVEAPVFETKPEQADSTVSYYSRAELRVHPLDKPGQTLDGFNLFLDGKLVGQSPLVLSDFLVNRGRYLLSAEKAGWLEASRPELPVPEDGLLDIAVLRENPAGYYTRPSFVVGLSLMAASLVAYNQPDGQRAGLALLGSGVGLIAVTQALARWWHVPRLKNKLNDYNRRHLEDKP